MQMAVSQCDAQPPIDTDRLVGGLGCSGRLQPGQKGTKRLIKKYGDRVVGVRYRFDAQTGRRYTTVELIQETASLPSST
jgi:hypothetical protein